MQCPCAVSAWKRRRKNNGEREVRTAETSEEEEEEEESNKQKRFWWSWQRHPTVLAPEREKSKTQYNKEQGEKKKKIIEEMGKMRWGVWKGGEEKNAPSFIICHRIDEKRGKIKKSIQCSYFPNSLANFSFFLRSRGGNQRCLCLSRQK